VVASIPPIIFTKTSIKCADSHDCLRLLYRPNISVYRCQDGYCVEGVMEGRMTSHRKQPDFFSF
jgi:hypothetical protein